MSVALEVVAMTIVASVAMYNCHGSANLISYKQPQ